VMVLLGRDGHPFPEFSQSPNTSMIAGAFHWRRVTGHVLKLPDWDVTAKHRENADAMLTMDGFLYEASTSLPTVFFLMLMVWAFRHLVMTVIVTPAGNLLIPRPTTWALGKKRKKASASSALSGKSPEELTAALEAMTPDDRAKEASALGAVSPDEQFTKTLSRFENSGWEAVFYGMSTSVGLFVYTQEEWSVWPTSNIWVDWPLQPMSFAFRGYYLLMLAFYTQALISLIFIDKPRSDYFEYFLHHVVTIFLIGVSFYTRIQRYGLIILCLHDFGDIWLNCAKTVKYLGDKWDSTTTFLFAFFSVVFVLTRLIFLPLTVIPSGYWEAMQIDPPVPGFLPMNVALVILQCLHIFWFYLIVQAVKRQFASGNLEDVREDEDSNPDRQKAD